MKLRPGVTPSPGGTAGIPWAGLDPVGLDASDVLAVSVGRQLAGVSGAHIPINMTGDPSVSWMGPTADPQVFRGQNIGALKGGGGHVSVEQNGGLPASSTPAGLANTLQDLIGSLP